MEAQSKQRVLKLVYWNARGILNKKYELQQFLAEEDVDIMIIGETWLNNNHEFRIPNYKMYRNDRQLRPHGGTAILLKRNIPHASQPKRNSNIEHTILVINPSDNPITIISTYSSPNVTITNADLESLFHLNRKTILLGDLNAKHRIWGCHTTNASGRALFDFFEQNDVQLHIPSNPTHYAAQGRPEILDIAITKNIQHDPQLTVIQDLSSDHNPIMVTINEQKNTSQTITRKLTNWTRFHYHLKTHTTSIQALNTIEDIDKEIKILTEEINTAIEQCTKTVELKGQVPILLPTQVRELIKEKRKARKRAQRTLHPEDINRATQLNNQVRTALKNEHIKMWENTMEQMNCDRNNIWKIIKSRRATDHEITFLQGARGLGYTSSEKAEILADSIENQCTINEPDTDDEDAINLQQEVELCSK